MKQSLSTDTTIINKTTSLLSNKFKFTKNERRKISGEKRRRLKRDATVYSITFERIRAVGSVIPWLYGLPKIHKKRITLRPVTDMSNSSYHGMIKWLAEIIEILRKQIARFMPCDRFEIADVTEPERMYLLGVRCLFTSVPSKETAEYIENYVENSGTFFGMLVDELECLFYVYR